MKKAIIDEAKSREANYSGVNNDPKLDPKFFRPSRRSTDDATGWFITTISTQRSIVAHALSAEGSDDKKLFEDALVLEADFSLGRNPLNMINMTTATTGLADKKSPENAYTSGWNDGTPGVHPGHTPYMNQYHWGWTGMVMGNPPWMTSKNYPVITFNANQEPANNPWPYGELYYNTRYVYAANEFTPQQSMRGKTALYGYLYAISPSKQDAGIKNIVSRKHVNMLHLFPVPAKEIIQIAGVKDGSPYMIYNITGMKITSGTLSGGTINVSQLKHGTYFIALDNLRGKFIKS
jgi:hypothetical protein